MPGSLTSRELSQLFQLFNYSYNTNNTVIRGGQLMGKLALKMGG